MKVAVIALMLVTFFAVRSKALPAQGERRETRNYVLLELLERYIDDELETANRGVDSGIKVDQDSIDRYNELKEKKEYTWFTFKISSGQKTRKIVPDQFGEPSSSYVGVDPDKAAWDDLIKHLPRDEPRYAVFDHYFMSNGEQKNEIVFVDWSPEGANMREKMDYSSSGKTIKKQFNVLIELFGTDVNEISYDKMVAKVVQNM